MKPLHTLCFAASLALNAAFAFWFFSGERATPSSTPAKSPVSAGLIKPTIDANTWPALRTDDLPALATRLRDAGFPPSMVRVIVGHQFAEPFAAQRKTLAAASQTRPFWQNQETDPQASAALNQLNREITRRYREIFGAEADEDHPLMTLDRGWHFNYLPTEKAAQVERLVRDYDTRQWEIRPPGALLGTDRERMAAFEQEKRAALAKILTSAELLEYDLRSSNTARNLRNDLAVFAPTESEFRALFEVQHAFDQRWNPPWNPPASRPENDDAYPQLWAQYKAVLGPERIAQYQRANEPNYQRTTKFVARLQLPPQTTEQLWSAREEFQNRVSRLHRDRTLSAEQHTARLDALAQEAAARVTPLVGGARNLEAYRQYGGAWLSNLAPRPPAP